MTAPVVLDHRLAHRDVAAVASGRRLALSPAAWERIAAGHRLVEALVDRGIAAYGVTTGVGALADVAVDRSQQRALSRNLVMSHAVGAGEALPAPAVRAIIAASVANLAHGRSGVRPVVVERLLALLAADILPVVPARGSVGYLAHMAHVAAVMIGEGRARAGGTELPGRAALAAAGLEPLVLEAKEGLSLLNGSPCATGLGALALARAARLVEAADIVAAMSLEALGAQRGAFSAEVAALRPSPGIAATAARLGAFLGSSPLLALAEGSRTQDALSLRAVPQVHGQVRDALEAAARVVDLELASVTDNPALAGTPDAPRALSQAHAVAPGLAIALDSAAIAVAHLAGISERRLDRLVNPLVSGLPAFLAADAGAGSGFMIAQYSAAALVGNIRRLAVPASLDGGVTSGLQEDYLVHPTASAEKLLRLIADTEDVLAIELAAAGEALDIRAQATGLRPALSPVLERLRTVVPRYADDRPLRDLLDGAAGILRSTLMSDETEE